MHHGRDERGITNAAACQMSPRASDKLTCAVGDGLRVRPDREGWNPSSTRWAKPNFDLVPPWWNGRHASLGDWWPLAVPMRYSGRGTIFYITGWFNFQCLCSLTKAAIPGFKLDRGSTPIFAAAMVVFQNHEMQRFTRRRRMRLSICEARR